MNMFGIVVLVTWVTVFPILGCDENSSLGNTPTDAGLGDPPTFGATETRFYVTDFEMQSSILVDASGEEIASASFSPDDWYPVTVPTTVLRGLVANGVYPDPYVGLNNMMIPDADDDFNEAWGLATYSHMPNHENPWADPYFFRAVFELPTLFESKQVLLNLNGINYRADIWLNGSAVARADDVVGMFEQFTFDVTEAALPGAENILTVAIHPLDYPGLPAPPQLTPLGSFGANCGEDSEIGKNVTMQASVGWDWIPAVRDRNMGIWQDVFFSAVSPLDIRFPNAKTSIDFADPVTADVTLSAEIVNSSTSMVSGTLWAKITPYNFESDFSVEIGRPIQIDAGGETAVVFSSDEFENLVLESPALWQPVGFGAPNLYNVSLVLTVNGEVSDAEAFRFGVREITTEISQGANPGRTFFINGQRVQMRGGAWVPDLLLHRDSARYENELRFSKEANFNTVRIWGGGVTPPDEFFEICDELGLLVWLDFWITGDCQGTWGKGTTDWPLEGDVFLSNARSVVKRVRSHPSLTLYTAGNEGIPREDLYKGLRNDIVDGLDGTRPFLPSSGMEVQPEADWGLSLPDDAPSGVYTGGPYWWVEPSQYFIDARSTSDWLFKDEIGVAAVPPLRSLEKFILDTEPDPDAPFPLNSTFAYHDAANSDWRPMFGSYDEAIRARYGDIESLADYAAKAQLVTAENMRALFEAANTNLNRVGGLLLWKTNSAWPSVIWQVYDWYLRPNAGYYFAKKAGEMIHVQLNLETFEVEVVNRGTADANGMTVRMAVRDQASAIVAEESAEVDVAASSVETVFSVAPATVDSGVLLVQLVLADAADETISENLYWVAADNDFTSLTSLPATELTVEASAESEDGVVKATVDVTNPNDTLAFFANLLVLKGADGEEVLPTYWEDNYITLLPGETRRVTASFNGSDLGDAEPIVRVEGINIIPVSTPLR